MFCIKKITLLRKEILVCGNAPRQIDILKSIESFIINTINNVTKLEKLSDLSPEVLEFEKGTILSLNKDLEFVTSQISIIEETCKIKSE